MPFVNPSSTVVSRQHFSSEVFRSAVCLQLVDDKNMFHFAAQQIWRISRCARDYLQEWLLRSKFYHFPRLDQKLLPTF